MPLWSTETSDGVVVASYANPPKSYLTAEGTEELAALIKSWRDPGVRAVVLCGGHPGAFITHYSVEELLALASDADTLCAVGTELTRGYHAMLLSLRDLPKPVIVAMNGDTMGGGFELSLSCDIRIGQRGDFRYGLPEVRVGIIPGGSGTQRLARLIGAGAAVEFIMRGRVVTPDQALELRLVHEVVDDAVERARALAAELAALPPKAIACAKRAVYAGSDTQLQAGLEIESAAFLEAMLTDDGRRAMQAYVDQPLDERRGWIERADYPQYSGR